MFAGLVMGNMGNVSMEESKKMEIEFEDGIQFCNSFVNDDKEYHRWTLLPENIHFFLVSLPL